MSDLDAEQVRDAVREHYGKVAEADAPGCAPGCCGGGVGSSLKLGYSEQDLAAVPAGADLGLGCGNPQAIANLRPGETVVDLGSGAGFDCFLAAKRVLPGGSVIGVDMTASMVTKARNNAKKAGIGGVEFRLGEIEHLPEALQEHVASLTGCVSGASTVEDLKSFLSEAGFTQVEINVKPGSRDFIRNWMPGSGSEDYVASAAIEAVKPKDQVCCGPNCCAS